jgi:hypothetical protein
MSPMSARLNLFGSAAGAGAAVAVGVGFGFGLVAADALVAPVIATAEIAIDARTIETVFENGLIVMQ